MPLLYPCDFEFAFVRCVTKFRILFVIRFRSEFVFVLWT